MVELDFSKAGKDVSLTIMQMGKKTNVTGSGEGLVNGAAKPDAEASAVAAREARTVEPEDPGPVRFPVAQEPYDERQHDGQTPFRHGLTASVPADLPA